MTREETIKTIEFAKTYISKDGLIKQALDLALSALRPVSREQIAKVWGGCDRCQPPCISCDNMYAWDRYGKPNECTGCPEAGYKNYVAESSFCEFCGKPLTDEAVQIVMERIDELHET